MHLNVAYYLTKLIFKPMCPNSRPPQTDMIFIINLYSNVSGYFILCLLKLNSK